MIVASATVSKAGPGSWSNKGWICVCDSVWIHEAVWEWPTSSPWVTELILSPKMQVNSACRVSQPPYPLPPLAVLPPPVWTGAVCLCTLIYFAGISQLALSLTASKLTAATMALMESLRFEMSGIHTQSAVLVPSRTQNLRSMGLGILPDTDSRLQNHTRQQNGHYL